MEEKQAGKKASKKAEKDKLSFHLTVSK